ncbi:hypothetical protein [Demetria terragena]|uniref:hypothetical protein n=1 Tax=Demetria terragena TaxID=63959 RepID=UPI00035D01AC|nr:hypothetical protein [Demetria terragena]
MEQKPSVPTRRALARTAWTVPALVVLPAARAAAASCNSLPQVGFPGSWSTPTNTGYLGNGWSGFQGNQFGGNADPARGLGSAETKTQLTLQLEPNKSYRLTFPVVNWFRTNSQTASFSVTAGGQSTTRTTVQVNPGTIAVEFTTTASASITIQLTFAVAQSPLSTSGDDIAVSSPTLVCI